jgi:hypothetical protein
LEPEAELAATGAPLAFAPFHYARVGINTVEDLVTALAADGDGARALAAGAPLITDDDNRMATSSVYDFGQGLTPDAVGRVLAPHDPLQRSSSWIYRTFRARLSFDYIARRVTMFVSIDRSALQRLSAMANALGNTPAAYVTRIATLTATGEHDRARQLAREAIQLFPDDPALRYAYVRPWIGMLARDTAMPEIEAAAEALPEEPAALIEAARLMAQRDFESVAALDRQLARVPWTEPWKFDAVQARAEWRGRLPPGPLRKRAGEECIAIIDEAIVVQPTLALYEDRARCAIAAGRPDVLVESLWYFGQGTYANSLRLTPDDRTRAKRDLEAVVRVLRETVKDPASATRLDAQRANEVVGKLEANIERLAQL